MESALATLIIVQWAVRAGRAGLKVFPVTKGSKTPAIRGWQSKATRDVKKIRRFFRKYPGCNYGIITGRHSLIVVIDIDGLAGEKSLAALEKKYGALPKTVEVITPGGGRHLFFKCLARRIRNSVGTTLGVGIDVRGNGGYVVGAGSRHPNGGRYQYRQGRESGNCSIARLPDWLATLITKRRTKAAVATDLAVPEKLRKRATKYVEAVLEKECARLNKAPMHQRNATLNLCAFKLGQFLPYCLIEERALTEQLKSIARDIGLAESEIMPTIKSGLVAGALQPRRLPFKGAPAAEISHRRAAQPSDDVLTKELACLGENDADNAQRFALRMGGLVLHAPGMGWLVYDGKIWQPDRHRKRVKLAIEVATKIADEAKFLPDKDCGARNKFAQNSRSKHALDKMLDLAVPLLSIDDANLDNAPDLLCVRNGTIDLSSGRLEPHDSRDLITKFVDVDYDRTVPIPRFTEFLHRVTGGDSDLMAFLQRAVGYSITGRTGEQVFFFLHGPRGTGKSTLLKIMRMLLQRLALHTPTSTLMVKQYDSNIPNDVARLKGARLVTATETNYNQQLDEAKIKAWTGEDTITARFLHGEFFEFMPEFKLWIAANDFPRVRATDGALWDRIRVIPFNVQIPEGQRNQDLLKQFEPELPGILAWAVKGSRQWRRHGLGKPAAVSAMTDKWKKHADAVKRFFMECCSVRDGGFVSAKPLYARYKKWCHDHGEQPLSTSAFKAKMIELNVTHKRLKKGSIWEKIEIVK